MRLFAVTLEHGPQWDSSQSLEGQTSWNEHAAFMDALVADGFVVLGGPVGSAGALLIVRVAGVEAIRERLAADPWSRLDLLHIASILPWTLRLGSLA